MFYLLCKSCVSLFPNKPPGKNMTFDWTELQHYIAVAKTLHIVAKANKALRPMPPFYTD
jgi:hypothetical protein